MAKSMAKWGGLHAMSVLINQFPVSLKQKSLLFSSFSFRKAFLFHPRHTVELSGSQGYRLVHLPSKVFLTGLFRLSPALSPPWPASHSDTLWSTLAHSCAWNERIPKTWTLLLYQSLTRHCNEAFLWWKYKVRTETEPDSPRISIAL